MDRIIEFSDEVFKNNKIKITHYEETGGIFIELKDIDGKERELSLSQKDTTQLKLFLNQK